MTYQSIDALWWQIAFILIAGWIATDLWRVMGVLLGNRIRETSEVLVFVRAVATALVAAVIAQLIVFPSGALAEQTSLGLRLAAGGAGFAAFLGFGQRVAVGVFGALGVLGVGMALGL
ncbi:MAG: AzlD domain-containing protein [Roseitalea sp.]|jgi:branched-subunit amino acid transport protein|uniref:AzlD domain-containing protein n=1 Tax=Oceaniradius stylonematis TaxID=2184161 RepID=UPI001B078B51|nr:AzlD domain-containing protein [Oceaniradius stylonematis]MBO6552330.1 AzlD domain-containing protein [Roseitalea sp.]MBO6950750.1 AzlD domain-containing protein [Rhizobiaceae bacterium]MBO6591263.1 AzlD domain-containing protein [Roseitalea sp.]MBO6599118.1 AzlD domain-containing protein [Roseitalea sp.]MBO6613695.1 AzlD domain-containing protein [Roseitalea sp.]